MVTLKKYFLLAVLMFALMFISVSTQTYASGVPVGDFTVTGEESNYTYANNTLTVVNGGEITISGTTVSDHILVPSGVTADITLDGVNIQFSDGTSGWELGTCAFEVRGTANITLKGVNTLKSGAQTAGLQVESGASVAIDGDGSITITGGSRSAGIGGRDTATGGVDAGNITINGGTVTAISPGSGAGIGGGHSKSGGNITINGGVVNASVTGSGLGAGIGGGSNGAGGNITINGGTVTATGGGQAAGIGSGSYGSGGAIIIDGGNVTATGGAYSSGIGGGYSVAGGSITIKSGTVNAKGQYGSPGIGGGRNGAGGNIFISGGTITATSGNGLSHDIGYGLGSAGGSFQTGEDGAAIINGVIADKTYQENWSGIFFEDTTDGAFYGDVVTLNTDATVQSDNTITVGTDETLEVANGATLNIAEGATLTNSGKLNIHGVLTCDGTLAGNGLFATSNIIDADIAQIPAQKYTGEVIEPSPQLITANRTYFGKVFTLTTDSWTITYKENLDPGIATMTMIKSGNATITRNFNINDSYTQGDFNVSGGVVGKDFEHINGTLTIKTTTQLIVSNVDSDIPTTNIIVVQDGITANITLEGVNISTSTNTDVAALDVKGTSTANITLVGNNTLISGTNRAGVEVNSGASVIIGGTGSLNATGGQNGAGIGGGTNKGGGNITINNGNITATSIENSSAIGGGYAGAGGNIIITGGTVTATGSPDWYAAIGGWRDADQGSFSTGENGSALIYTVNPIGDRTNLKNWKGIFFEANSGTVYGNQTLAENLTINSNESLNIPVGAALIINSGKTLTNNGVVYRNGTLNGKLTGNSFAGDVNNSGILDVGDLVEIASASNYNKSVGYNKQADINADGVVNFIDLALIRNSAKFGR